MERLQNVCKVSKCYKFSMKFDYINKKEKEKSILMKLTTYNETYKLTTVC